MQLFSADTTIFKKYIYIYFFAPENMKKPLLKVAPNRPPIFFFGIANRPKTSPKIRHFSCLLYNDSGSRYHDKEKSRGFVAKKDKSLVFPDLMLGCKFGLRLLHH